jgi:hypothetical protein
MGMLQRLGRYLFLRYVKLDSLEFGSLHATVAVLGVDTKTSMRRGKRVYIAFG